MTACPVAVLVELNEDPTPGSSSCTTNEKSYSLIKLTGKSAWKSNGGAGTTEMRDSNSSASANKKDIATQAVEGEDSKSLEILSNDDGNYFCKLQRSRTFTVDDSNISLIQNETLDYVSMESDEDDRTLQDSNTVLATGWAKPPPSSFLTESFGDLTPEQFTEIHREAISLALALQSAKGITPRVTETNEFPVPLNLLTDVPDILLDISVLEHESGGENGPSELLSASSYDTVVRREQNNSLRSISSRFMDTQAANKSELLHSPRFENSFSSSCNLLKGDEAKRAVDEFLPEIKLTTENCDLLSIEDVPKDKESLNSTYEVASAKPVDECVTDSSEQNKSIATIDSCETPRSASVGCWSSEALSPFPMDLARSTPVKSPSKGTPLSNKSLSVSSLMNPQNDFKQPDFGSPRKASSCMSLTVAAKPGLLRPGFSARSISNSSSVGGSEKILKKAEVKRSATLPSSIAKPGTVMKSRIIRTNRLANQQPIPVVQSTASKARTTLPNFPLNSVTAKKVELDETKVIRSRSFTIKQPSAILGTRSHVVAAKPAITTADNSKHNLKKTASLEAGAKGVLGTLAKTAGQAPSKLQMPVRRIQSFKASTNAALSDKASKLVGIKAPEVKVGHRDVGVVEGCPLVKSRTVNRRNSIASPVFSQKSTSSTIQLDKTTRKSFIGSSQQQKRGVEQAKENVSEAGGSVKPGPLLPSNIPSSRILRGGKHLGKTLFKTSNKENNP